MYIFLAKITQFCQRIFFIYNIKGKNYYNECSNLAGINKLLTKNWTKFWHKNLVTVDLNKSENKSDIPFAHSQYESNVQVFLHFYRSYLPYGSQNGTCSMEEHWKGQIIWGYFSYHL